LNRDRNITAESSLPASKNIRNRYGTNKTCKTLEDNDSIESIRALEDKQTKKLRNRKKSTQVNSISLHSKYSRYTPGFSKNNAADTTCLGSSKESISRY
jgi:hypothetical protein